MASITDEPSILSFIQELNNWPKDEFANNITDGRVLPKLTNALDKNDLNTNTSSEVLKAVLSCVAFVDLKFIQDEVLQHAMPKAMKFLTQVFHDLELKSDFDFETTKLSLIQSADLIQQIDDCLQCVLKNSVVQINWIYSLPINTSQILLLTFRHCKESEYLYGENLDSLYETLTHLFKSAQSLQTHLLTLLTENIKFDFTCDDDIELFSEVLKILFEVGEMLVTLDVRSTALQWRTVTKLVTDHKDALIMLQQRKKTEYVIVSQPIGFLADQVRDEIKKIIKARHFDEVEMQKSSKVCSFFIQIIIRLTSEFKCELGPCHEQLLKMLCVVHRYSTPLLLYDNFPHNVISLITTHVTVGAETLLPNLLEDEEFISKFCQCDVSCEDLNWGFLLLSISIVKCLTKGSAVTRAMWLNAKCNVLQQLFRTISKSHVALTSPVVYSGVALRGQSPVECGLYDAILTHFGGFLLCVNPAQFEIMEKTLLAEVFNKNIVGTWNLILAADLLCLIDRYGTAELCSEHVIILIKALQKVPSLSQTSHPLVINLKSLLSRIYSLLPTSQMDLILKQYPLQTYAGAYTCIGLQLLYKSHPDSGTLMKEIVQDAENSIDAFFELKSVASYISMTEKLLLLSTADAKDITETPFSLLEKLVELWKCITYTHDISLRIVDQETCIEGSHCLNNFIYMLIKTSRPFVSLLTNSQTYAILSKLSDILNVSNTSVRLHITYYLKSLAEKEFNEDADQKICFQLLSDMFRALLSDGNVLVEQSCLEGLGYFAHVTEHEEILVLTVKNDDKLQNKVTEYLQRNARKSPETMKLQTYLQMQNEVVMKHVCQSKTWAKFDDGASGQTVMADIDSFVTEDFFEPPNKKLKIDDDKELVDKINQINVIASNIVVKHSGCQMSDAIKSDITSIIEKLKRLV